MEVHGDTGHQRLLNPCLQPALRERAEPNLRIKTSQTWSGMGRFRLPEAGYRHMDGQAG